MFALLAAAAAAPAPKVSAAPLQLTQPLTAPLYAPHTWFAQHAGWLTHTLAGLAILFAIGLIVLLAIQTTKQEGLSGTIGGRVESAYRTRPGMEENMKRLTGFVAVSLVVVWAILSLTGI
ncbi:MAG: preprotein translocase subunit SecG [Candidatus Eremiobacteraeota bacterium]|nr:preprotein translocase subunit SecG [Candidatus Eremiobacteraeota bacterium]